MPPPPREPAVHLPVLLDAVLEYLELRPGLIVVDGTAGAGGHSREIAKHIGDQGTLIGLDRDPMMLSHAQDVLKGANVVLEQASYAQLGDVLQRHGLRRVDRVLVDLGLSSDQLADRQRGFSFESGGPLDMRFDTASGRSAAELVNHLAEKELVGIFREYGEERFAGRIARRIVERRPIATADQLAEIISRAVPRSRGPRRIHPATRVFQALRIAVNDELGQLRELLERQLPECLSPGGRAVVISFHSLEDRLVKHAFRNKDLWSVLTRKPVRASADETLRNPRARSAKLRAAVYNGMDAGRDQA